MPEKKAPPPPAAPGGPAGPAGPAGSAGPDLEALVRQATELGNQFKAAFEKVADDAQVHFDREVAKFMGQHPELYAELQKTIRQVKKTVDKAASEFGLKPK